MVLGPFPLLRAESVTEKTSMLPPEGAATSQFLSANIVQISFVSEEKSRVARGGGGSGGRQAVR